MTAKLMAEDLTTETLAVAPEPGELARQADLIYVNDNDPGYRRKRWGKGFTYLDPDGEHVRSPELRARFESLVIPPAWTDVWICLHADGHIQVTGRDDQGRKQYIYHERWEEVRNRTKFDRILLFASVLPDIRAQVGKDLRRHHLPREKVLALVVRLLDSTLIRVGNAEYAQQNHSYGLTTLQDDHAEISSTTVEFAFQGKSGKEQHVVVKDPRLARLVRRCQELPGQHLFQYEDQDGTAQAITSTDVNGYLREITGASFTAKDFRTWGGTVAAAMALHELGPAPSEKECKASIVQAIKAAAKRLGNTPAVCRQYYVHPDILSAYEANSFCELVTSVKSAHENRNGSGDQSGEDGLSADEVAVMELLRKMEKRMDKA